MGLRLARSSGSRQTALAFGSRLLGIGLSFAVQLLLVRWAGVRGYGLYSYALGWATLLSLLASVGLPHAVVRLIPAYRVEEDWSSMHGLIRRSEHVVLGTGVLIAVLSSAILLAMDLSKPLRWSLLLAFWMTPLLAVMNLQRQLCRSVQQIGLAYVVPRLTRPLLMIGGGALLFYTTAPLTGPAAVALAVGSIVPVWFAQRYGFRKRLPKAVWNAAPIYALRRWLRVAFPMLWVGAMLVVLNQTDVLMIGAFLTPREAGFYRAASRIAVGASFVLLAVNSVAAPHFAALHADGAHARLQVLVRRLAPWIFWPSLLTTGLLCLFSGNLLGLFGLPFRAAQWPLVVLALGHLWSAATGPVGYLLDMTGHQMKTARIFGWSALANVALNALGIALFGLLGVALATAFCMAVWNTWMYRIVVRELDLHPSVLAFPR